MIYQTFINEEYEDFFNINEAMRGAIVIDIGAYIGDTAVFFGKKGANVYAYEPSKELYEIAKKNIETNNINANIFNVGVGNKNTNGKITKNENDINDTTGLVIFDEFEPIKKILKDRFLFAEDIKLISLNEVLEQFKLVYLLKMDCEGCEFPSISSVKDENLHKIKYIIMEFHFFDPHIIISKLKINNFEVFATSRMLYARNLS